MIDREQAIFYLEKIHNTLMCKPNFATDKTKQGMGLALMYLYQTENKERTAGELAKELKCSTARIAALIHQLEEKKYVEKKKSDIDQRITIVKLTNEGEKFVSEILEHGIEGIQDYVEYIGIDNMEFLISILDKTKDYFIKRKEEKNV